MWEVFETSKSSEKSLLPITPSNGAIMALVLSSAIISSQSAVTAVSGDYVLIGDTSDSNALKKALVSDLGTSDLDGLSDAKSAGSGDFAGGILISNDGGTGTLSAAYYNTGLGWEVWCDGMEITQFTYFQQMAGIECKPVSVEPTSKI